MAIITELGSELSAHKIYQNPTNITAKSVRITAIARSTIAQVADELGYIPLVGSTIGIARIMTALAVKALAILGQYLFFALADRNRMTTGPEQTIGTYTELGQRYSDLATNCLQLRLSTSEEIHRGLYELIPCCWTLFQDQGRKADEKSGVISNYSGAYGRYYYCIEDKGICYSAEKINAENMFLTAAPKQEDEEEELFPFFELSEEISSVSAMWRGKIQ